MSDINQLILLDESWKKALALGGLAALAGGAVASQTHTGKAIYHKMMGNNIKAAVHGLQSPLLRNKVISTVHQKLNMPLKIGAGLAAAGGLAYGAKKGYDYVTSAQNKSKSNASTNSNSANTSSSTNTNVGSSTINNARTAAHNFIDTASERLQNAHQKFSEFVNHPDTQQRINDVKTAANNLKNKATEKINQAKNAFSGWFNNS